MNIRQLKDQVNNMKRKSTFVNFFKNRDQKFKSDYSHQQFLEKKNNDEPNFLKFQKELLLQIPFMKKFLSNFEQEFLDNFIKKIRINHFYKKDIVFPKEKFFYEVLIVINGSVSQSDSEDILVPGNVFGLEFNDAKLAVYPSPKTYTALEHTFIGYIHRDIIQIIRKQQQIFEQDQCVNQILQFQSFKNFDEIKIKNISQRMQKCTFHLNQVIFDNSNEQDFVYFILEGSVRIQKKIDIEKEEGELEDLPKTQIQRRKSQVLKSFQPQRSKSFNVGLTILDQGQIFGKTKDKTMDYLAHSHCEKLVCFKLPFNFYQQITSVDPENEVEEQKQFFKHQQIQNYQEVILKQIPVEVKKEAKKVYWNGMVNINVGKNFEKIMNFPELEDNNIMRRLDIQLNKQNFNVLQQKATQQNFEKLVQTKDELKLTFLNKTKDKKNMIKLLSQFKIIEKNKEYIEEKIIRPQQIINPRPSIVSRRSFSKPSLQRSISQTIKLEKPQQPQNTIKRTARHTVHSQPVVNRLQRSQSAYQNQNYRFSAFS